MNKAFLFILSIVLCVIAQSPDFPVVFRDFTTAQGDFEVFINGVVQGMVEDTLSSDRKPIRSSLQQNTNIRNLDQWFRDTSYSKNIPKVLTFTQKPGGILFYDNQNFFLIDNEGWGNEGNAHNYHFTMELHCNFTYNGGEDFTFQGDDDVWVFINNHLAVDIGGIHGPSTGKVNLDNLGLTKGNTYPLDLFFAERHTVGSTIQITTSIVLIPAPKCVDDKDGDTVIDCYDNCPDKYNPSQRDCNANGIGDDCDEQRAPLEYPFVTRLYKNYNQSASTTDTNIPFAQSSTFEPLSTSTPVTFQFNDPLTGFELTDLTINVDVAVKNSYTANCIVSLQLSSSFNSSDVKKGLVTPGNYMFSRNLSQIDAWYSFLNGHFYKKGKTGDGKNTVTIKSESAECNGQLSVGSIIVTLRYTYQTNNQTNFFVECIPGNDPCLYGTYRFGGFCACWSGAYGRDCTMDTATPGAIDDPDTGYASTVKHAWNQSIPEIQGIYYKVDYDLMANKDFYRNFTGHPTCPDLNNWQKVIDLETGGIVTLETAYFEDQFLTMFVSQPFVDGRADGAVFLNWDDDKILSYVDCYYPRSSYIFKLVDGCKDIWKFQVPWDSAKQCLWNQTQQDAFLVYTGRVIVHNMEWVGIEQWRIIRAVLRVKLRFQRLVQVESTDISIFNKILQQAAITKQLVALQLGDPALIEIGTLMDYPYKLKDFSLTFYPNDKIAGIVQTFDDCSVAQGASCRQYFRTSLSLTQGTCTLDGSYRLNFTIDCGKALGTKDCPLQKPEDFVASVDYTLHSENFCAEVTVDVGIVGNIKVFEDATFKTTRTAYIVNRAAYFLLAVNSDLNEPKNNGVADPDKYEVGGTGTVMKFSKVDIVNVAIKYQDGTQVRIFDNKIPVNFTARGLTDLQTDCKQITGTQENNVGFSFVFTRAAFPVPKNGQLKFTVVADAQATYATSKKRFTLATSGDDTNSFSVDTNIQDDGNGPTSTSTGTGSGTGTGQNTGTNSSTALIASLALFLFALFF